MIESERKRGGYRESMIDTRLFAHIPEVTDRWRWTCWPSLRTKRNHL